VRTPPATANIARVVERTLSIIKPDVVSRDQIGAILQHVEQAGLRIVATRMLQLDRRQAEGFYDVHRERPFFQSLVQFMTSGPVVVSVLEGDDAIARYRKLMGATDPEQADAGTLRKLFGTDVERNAVHGSDAPDTASAEVAYFFGKADLVTR
jgi:nucleoside-diphosphate kinase